MSLVIQAIVVHKPIEFERAHKIAQGILKTNKKIFSRETSTSYRFRAIPKTKFRNFISKVIDSKVTLVLGHLK